MKINILGALFFTLLSFSSFGQKAMPVKWSFDIEKVSESDYDIICTANIQTGWYLYAQKQESNMGPIPTSFSFDNLSDFELVGEFKEIGDKIEKFDDYFEMNIAKYAQSVKFVQRVKNTKKAQNVKGSVEFMTCDDHQCLPPTNIEFTLNFK